MDVKVYKKEKSFSTFNSRLGTDVEAQRLRAVTALERALALPDDSPQKEVWTKALVELRILQGAAFFLTPMIADEISRLDDDHLPDYLYHRYRYDIYPVKRILDAYPPYLQIEPSSICNYRCVFCYQVNQALSAARSSHMGKMPFALFKEIIDQVQGHVQFISLASRGEPFVCDDIDQMLRFCYGKFLGLKLNTNGSLLNEAHCHAILAGGVNTVVFSLDTADAGLYAKMRVKGDLGRVEKNIELFSRIRKEHYPSSKIITRISGVKFDEGQDMGGMLQRWGDLVDQICFVKYNPWENAYDAEPNGVVTPCSDLWRRMFIWFDGKANPCDVDYLSSLSVGALPGMSVKELWRSPGYEKLRQEHMASGRSGCEPCRRCALI